MAKEDDRAHDGVTGGRWPGCGGAKELLPWAGAVRALPRVGQLLQMGMGPTFPALCSGMLWHSSASSRGQYLALWVAFAPALVLMGQES